MKKLQTPVIVLISMAAASLVLAVILILTMPTSIKENFFSDAAIENHIQMHRNGDIWGEDGDSLRDEYDGHYGRDGFHGKHGAKGFLFLPLLVIGIVLLVRSKNNRMTKCRGASILSEQFAEGKISEEEYRRKRSILEED